MGDTYEHWRYMFANTFEEAEARAAALHLSGSDDHLMPPAVQRSKAEHYKSNTITEIKEFPVRSHLMPALTGWEEIADYALAWAVEHAVHPPQVAAASGPAA